MGRKIVAPQRREQIVEALFDCLADNGHETVTVKDIARRANLHYGVIHYYFKSKDEIVSAMADSIISKYERSLLERIKRARLASDKLQAALDFLVDEFIFNRRLNRVFYNLVQMAFERKGVRTALRKQLRVYRARISETIEDGIRDGDFAHRDSSEAAALMVALVEGMALQWVIEPRSLKRAEVLRLIGETIGKHLSDSPK
ncbi:MAG: TetR family transcriptional regulator [Candidatus Abyssobacteria bacterium SURF_17]|uniref:TetR family transcriptional regulator n=1 Tax=Candidatus Abyssobacteria bacterium SURF_17 TaxID=2093361 RepID=A0A419EYS0_9BACT|nr:MAG: TetR family transcriptional regulator [Candidatus Abyssubacteria bacterium SURF_17]